MHPSARARGALVLASLLAATACTGAPAVVAPSPTPSTDPSPPAASSPARIARAIDTVVRDACRTTPGEVKQLIPGAQPELQADAPLGTTCVWRKEGDTSVYVVVVAVYSSSYHQYEWTLPGPKAVVDLPGGIGVTTDQLRYCTVVIDVDTRAMDVQVHGAKEIGCGQARLIAAEVLSLRTPRPRTHQPPPQDASSGSVSVPRSSP